MPSSLTARISTRMWLGMAALAFTGQTAWAVENSWFNTFVYDTITPDHISSGEIAIHPR